LAEASQFGQDIQISWPTSRDFRFDQSFKRKNSAIDHANGSYIGFRQDLLKGAEARYFAEEIEIT